MSAAPAGGAPRLPSLVGSWLVGAAIGALSALLAMVLGLFSTFSYWGDPTAFAIVGAVVGAAAWPTRLRFVVASCASLLATAWLVVSYTSLASALTRGLVRHDALRPGDAIVVLASDVQDDGEPNSVELQRVLRGLELLAGRHAPRLLVTDLPPPTPSRLPALRGLAERLRVTGEIGATDLVRNTHDEAVVIAALFERRGWRTVLLVTSPTHTKRAAAVFEAQGLDVVSCPSPETRYDLDGLPQARDRAYAFSAALHERLGLWLYARRGWLERPATSR